MIAIRVIVARRALVKLGAQTRGFCMFFFVLLKFGCLFFSYAFTGLFVWFGSGFFYRFCVNLELLL